MPYIIRKPGTGTFFSCRGYDNPYFSNLLAAWPFDDLSKAEEAAEAMIERSGETKLEVYVRPNCAELGFDESVVSDLVKGLDDLSVELHPKPYDSVGALRDAAMDARDSMEKALIAVGMKLLGKQPPVATICHVLK